jgi:hypothetical protein
MTPQIVAERLLACYGEPEFAELVRELEPYLTVEVIAYLKERVDEEKLRDANHALHLATLADALVSQALPTPEAAIPAAELFSGQPPPIIADFEANSYFL